MSFTRMFGHHGKNILILNATLSSLERTEIQRMAVIIRGYTRYSMSLCTCQLGSFLGSYVEVVKGYDFETRFLDHPRQRISRARAVNDKNGHVLLCFCLFCALESNDQWDGEVELFGGANNTLSNVITSHNASKDVDENTLDLGVSQENLERLLDRLGCSTAA